MNRDYILMEKIKIERNTNGDSRVATECPTIDEFDRANSSHSEDVRKLCSTISEMLKIRTESHDWTKIHEPYRSMFYRDLCNTIKGDMEFNDGEWSKKHYEIERHHLLRRVPDNVDLLDVIEMIADCVSAGLARSGEVRPLEISSEILVEAVKNTVKLMEYWCEVEE